MIKRNGLGCDSKNHELGSATCGTILAISHEWPQSPTYLGNEINQGLQSRFVTGQSGLKESHILLHATIFHSNWP